MITINTLRPPAAPPVRCDFGWYYGTVSAPARLGEGSYTIGGNTYPPGHTTLVSNTSFPTGSNVAVASTVSLEASGTLVIYAGLLPNQRTMINYTVVDSTHIACTGGTGTFASGTPIYDPRYYVDPLPLEQTVVFDAVDHDDLGLATTTCPSGITIVLYQWRFGNGQIGYGPYATTIYPYGGKPAPDVRVALTVIDSLGRSFTSSHPIDLVSLTGIDSGSSVRVRQGADR